MDYLKCPKCGIPTIEDRNDMVYDDKLCNSCAKEEELRNKTMFKPGDKVKCIDATPYRKLRKNLKWSLREGEIYTVRQVREVNTKVWGRTLCMNFEEIKPSGNRFGGFNVNRFVMHDAVGVDESNLALKMLADLLKEGA